MYNNAFAVSKAFMAGLDNQAADTNSSKAPQV